MDPEPGFPGAAHLDYSCVLGVSGIAISATWLVSDDPAEHVAAWYRERLGGFEETAPGCWLRLEDRARRLIQVGPAQSWPPDRPAPAVPPPASARTLIMHSVLVQGGDQPPHPPHAEG